MADCPHCGRPVAIVRPKCLYCGKALPSELLSAVEASALESIQKSEQKFPHEPAASPAQESPERLLIILDLRQGEAKGLARALGVSAFEAGQQLRRGGFQLHRIAPEAEARKERARIAAQGVRVVLLRERTLAVEPLVVVGGALEARRLLGRTADGRLEWSLEDLLLVVKGPIQRQYQAEDTNVRRLRSASPSEGYRFHLHRLSDPRPLELDPEGFDFDAERGRVASSLLRLTTWMEAFEPRPRVDDSFRFLPPALGASETGGTTARALGRPPQRKGVGVVLDNLRQFRFYSAWRGALERMP